VNFLFKSLEVLLTGTVPISYGTRTGSTGRNRVTVPGSSKISQGVAAPYHFGADPDLL